MKFNELPKQKRLLIIMCRHEVATNKPMIVNCHGDQVISLGISKNKNSLMSMIYVLLQKNYISQETDQTNSNINYWLTYEGVDEVEYVLKQIDDANDVPMLDDNVNASSMEKIDKTNDPVEKLSLMCGKLSAKVIELEAQLKQKDNEIKELKAKNDSLKNSTDISSYIEQAQHWAKVANSISDNLNEYASLKHENEELKQKAATIQATLAEAYAKLDEKTNVLEKMKNELARAVSSCNVMADWLEQIKKCDEIA